MQSFTYRQRVQGMFHLMRPLPSCFGTLYMLLGVYLASDWSMMWTATTIRAMASVYLIIGFSFVINDYCDRYVDSIAKPERPLPSGRVTSGEAQLLMAVLLIVSISLAFTLPSVVWGLALFNIVLSLAYSMWLKNTLLVGNMSIALLDASTIVFGALLIGQVTIKIWIGFILMFLFVMAQEVLFAVRDIEGDAQGNLQTTANRLGQDNALRLFKGLAVLFAITAVSPVFIQLASWQYMVAAVLCTILPIMVVVGLLTWKVTQRTIWLSTRMVVLLWLTSSLPIILLK